MPDQSMDQREKLMQAALACERNGLLRHSQGNLSLRMEGEDRILITPSGLPYREMGPADLVVLDLQGRVLEGDRKPSYERHAHLAVYRARREVGACIHTEPPYLNALYLAGREVPPVLENFVYSFAGQGLAVMEPMMSGSEEFAAGSLQVLGEGFGAVWKSHGLFCVGKDIKAALQRSLVAEQAAQVYWLALVLGEVNPNPIPEVEFQRLVRAAHQG